MPQVAWHALSSSLKEHAARWHFVREEGTYRTGAASPSECLMVNVQVPGVPRWRGSKENDRVTFQVVQETSFLE